MLFPSFLSLKNPLKPQKKIPFEPIVFDNRQEKTRDKPSMLILSSTKRNQNYYRDQALSQQTYSIAITEQFDFITFQWDVSQIIRIYFDKEPEWIFINYIAAYTPKLIGFDKINSKVIGFVGDHYNFTDNSEAALQKQAFFKRLSLFAMVSAYPHTNNIVAKALEKENLPFIHLAWAIDPHIFYDLGKHRKYDIACMGAMTEGKYPFRRQVREWLEIQKRLKLFKKKRVKGANKSDHDGIAFNQALNQCRAAFTCASVMQYTLMKYFEIPAAGTLLFAEETADLKKLGFRDHIHYIKVTPDNFQQKMLHYLNPSKQHLAEDIRQKGMKFVQEKHSWPVRIEDFLAELALLDNGAKHINDKTS
ncbi:MAG TPA: glycosyltransferase family 1 protein [Thiothrix sp.]|nr:glycosyltransferase family 1 protein [Thiothrix sp.]